MNIRIRTPLLFILAVMQTVHTMEENNKCTHSEQPIQRAAHQQDRQPQPDDIVTLRGFDSELDIKVTHKLACLSVTIKHLIEDLGIDNPIPLPTITTQQLENFIIPTCELIDSLQCEATDNKIKRKLVEFFKNKKITIDDLLELIKNTNYLDIKLVFDAACDYFIETVEQQKTLEKVQELQTLVTNHKIPKAIQSKNGTTYLKNHRSFCIQKTLRGHTERVLAVALSPDNKHLISGSSDNTINIWDLDTGSCIKTLEGHTKEVRSVTLSLDGKHLISGSRDKTVKIWDIATGTCIKTLKGHTSVVFGVTLSSDKKHLISGSGDNTIKIWDMATGTCIKTLKDHKGAVVSVTVSSDGKNLISAACDKTIKIWDLATGTCIKTLKGHTKSVFTVTLSPDNKHLISGSADSTIKIWDLATGTCIKTLEGHTKSAFAVALSPDNKHLISGSADSTIKIWDLATGTCIKTLEGHTKSAFAVTLSPDGNSIISGSGDQTIKIWSMPTLNQKSEHAPLIIQAWLIAQIMKYTSDKPYIIVHNSEEEKIWNELTEETRQQLDNLVKK